MQSPPKPARRKLPSLLSRFLSDLDDDPSPDLIRRPGEENGKFKHSHGATPMRVRKSGLFKVRK